MGDERERVVDGRAWQDFCRALESAGMDVAVRQDLGRERAVTSGEGTAPTSVARLRTARRMALRPRDGSLPRLANAFASRSSSQASSSASRLGK